ncbi:hypothetical protein ACFQ2B_26195 [Streptomyces stramineus]|uniref:hypothetical protein n=1 Tax=Streptomyces TaxID=1883 RepID=UPI0031E19559
MADLTNGIGRLARRAEAPFAEAFALSSCAGRQDLAAAVDAAPITGASALLTTEGACLSKITTRQGSYYEAVITDLVTEDCDEDLDDMLARHGLPRWREAVIVRVLSARAHPHFPGSTSVQYLIIHPEATP